MPGRRKPKTTDALYFLTACACGDKSAEGTALRIVSDILLESMCPDMPWFKFMGEEGDEEQCLAFLNAVLGSRRSLKNRDIINKPLKSSRWASS
jgi:hypothetical protein